MDKNYTLDLKLVNDILAGDQRTADSIGITGRKKEGTVGYNRMLYDPEILRQYIFETVYVRFKFNHDDYHP
jgi:hypothetical protein